MRNLGSAKSKQITTVTKNNPAHKWAEGNPEIKFFTKLWGKYGVSLLIATKIHIRVEYIGQAICCLMKAGYKR